MFKNNINNMIKKYNEYINEKLYDKLHGFSNDEQVKDNLIQMYKKDEIDFSDLMKKCNKHNIEIDKYEIKELLQLKIDELKINIRDVDDYNSYLDYTLMLSTDEIFNLFGFDKGS
jgi:hypothetical protein